MRDALSKALIIDTVEVPGASGMIGMCACPGGRRAHNLDFDPALDLARDLEAIERFGARTLVTLMEERELDMLGVHTLPLEARRGGLQVKDASSAAPRTAGSRRPPLRFPRAWALPVKTRFE